MELLKNLTNLSAGSWTYMGGMAVLVAACIAMLVWDNRQEKKFRRDYDDKEDKFI